MSEDLGIYSKLEKQGVDTSRLGESTAYRVASDIGSGLLSAPVDAGAKGMNTVLDVANEFGIEEAIYSIVNGDYSLKDTEGFEPFRFDTLTEVKRDFGKVSALEEGTSDFAGLVGGTIITGGTKLGLNVLGWGSKGNIGRKVFAEALTTLPVDVLLSEDTGEHLLFDDNTKESIINRRAKNIIENAGMGMVGDFALRGVSKAYKTWRGAGKTADDATQATFNMEVPEGQADEVNKVRPTAELIGHEELHQTYIQNPMYKIENRESVETITADIFKQMDNVSKAEYRVRDASNVRFAEASAKEPVPFNPTPEGYTPEDVVIDNVATIGGKQDREDMLNIFDAWASGKVSDEVSEKYTRRFLRSFLEDDVDEDVLRIMRDGLTGKEKESAMRKVREKFMNNPFLVDEQNFQDKLKVQAILSKKLGFDFTKKRRSMLEVLESYKDLALRKDTDKKFAKAVSKLSKDTGMDQEALLRNMSNLGVTTDRLPEYVRGLTDLNNTYLEAMTSASKALIKELKESGGTLDMGSKAFKKWFTAFGASNEVYAGVAHVKGNIGRAMRTMQESKGSGIKNYISQFDDGYKKGTRTQAQEEASSSYMRAKQVTQAHEEAVKKGARKRPDGSPESIIELAQDPKAFTDELVSMIRMSSDIGRAKRLVSGAYKTEKQGLADMFISMGISNMLASPMTIGKIALSTANYVVYKQTLIPVFSGLANMVTKGDTGQRPVKDLVQRWVGMARVVQKYAQMDQKSMSRGFRGMQIEGQGFTDMKFKDLLKFVDEKANNPISKFGGKLMSAPLWFGNQVMSKGIIPVDDFFRRVMLEAETEGAIHNLYVKGIKGKPSVTRDMASSFNNFEDYRKTMLPMFTDVKNVLYDLREATDDEVRKKMAETFNKYAITRLDDDAQAVIMAEVLRAERRAAEAVSQETTDDLVLGRVIKQGLNAIESHGPMGRVVASTLVPFQTAPINLMRSAMEETPGLNLLSKRWRNKYQGGGKDKNEAIAQVLAGTTVGMGAWGLVNSLPVYGHIPIEEMKGAQEMGIQPYSIVLDGKAYSYDFLGTFKAPLAMLADYKRYGMEGNNVEAFKQSLKTFALAAGNNPYFDSMQEITSLFSSGVTEKDLARLITSKSTQFLQIGSGLNRAVKAGMGGEVETSALSEYYDSVWLRELDMRNKDNPAYRFFRDFTNPKAYTQKTNLFGEGLTRNGGDMASFLPYISMGISSTPAPTSPGLVLLKELELVNQDFTEIGDVIVDGARAQEIKEKTFGDQGLGLARLLNSYATDDAFMSASDSYRKGVISKLVTDHISQVQSNMGLDVIEKQYKIDELNRKLDFDSHGAELDISASARKMGEYIYSMEKSKIDKGTIKTQGVDQILK